MHTGSTDRVKFPTINLYSSPDKLANFAITILNQSPAPKPKSTQNVQVVDLAPMRHDQFRHDFKINNQTFGELLINMLKQ